MKTKRTQKEVYANGKRGRPTCLLIYESGEKIMVSAESDKLTDKQLAKALAELYPGRDFITYRRDGYVYASTDFLPEGEL